MMTAEVLRPYTDRFTRVAHLPGERVELTEERAAELCDRGFARVVEVKQARRKATKQADAGLAV